MRVFPDQRAWRRTLLFVACFFVPSVPWYPDGSRDAVPILYENTCLPKQLLEIANVSVQAWEVGVCTHFVMLESPGQRNNRI